MKPFNPIEAQKTAYAGLKDALKEYTPLQKRMLIMFFKKEHEKIDQWFRENPDADQLPLVWSPDKNEWVWLTKLFKDEKHKLFDHYGKE